MRAAKLFLTVVGVVILLGIVFISTIKRVPPGTIGVKQALWGGAGILDQDFDTGFHLGITGYHKWHFLDRRTHFVTFADSGSDSDTGELKPPLILRTKDNNTATFDLSVTYRIREGEGHSMVEQGLKDVYRQRVFTTVESVMREELANLASEDIYSTEKRLAASQDAMPKLEEALKAFYVKPEQVLIRAVRFTGPYEQKLQEKQLTYQNKLLAGAEELVENQRAITETKNAEIEAAEKELRGDWDKRLEQLRATTEVEIAKVNADADRYEERVRAEADADYETMIAEGHLAIAKSEALRNELRNKALDTVGGRIYLAQQAASNLQFDHVTLNSNDPNVPSILDINALVDLLVGKAE